MNFYKKGFKMIKKSILIWLSITPLAILNGGLRETFLTPWLGEHLSRPISGILLCFMIFIVSFIFIPKIGKGNEKTYIKIGVLWVSLTIIFETVLGLVTRMSCGEIFKAYDITSGNLWLIVVLFIGFAPWLVAKINGLYKKE
jgi:hypothetical protein